MGAGAQARCGHARAACTQRGTSDQCCPVEELDCTRGGWRDRRLTVPTLLLFGVRDLYVSPKLLAGSEPHADEMRVELVPDVGHFLVNERPELVVDRAREFFG